MDPEQTQPIGTVWSGSTLFAIGASLTFQQTRKALFCGADFFKNQLFWKILSGIPSECQTDWIQIRPNILLGLIWVQTFRKSYQLTTLEDSINRASFILEMFNVCSSFTQSVLTGDGWIILIWWIQLTWFEPVYLKVLQNVTVEWQRV